MTILIIGILFFLAHALSLAFERYAVPDVLVLMILGIVAGPLTGILGPESFGKSGEVMSSIALVAILFEGGMSLELHRLGPTLRAALPLFILTFLASLGLTLLVALFLLHLEFLPALTLGCILASISPAVVLPLAKTLKLSRQAADRLTIETSLTDVFSIILVFTLSSAPANGSIEIGRMLGSMFSALVFAAIIGLVGSYVWLRSLDLVRRFPNTTLATFAFLFVIYGLSEFLGFSGAIAALAFGLGVANQPFGLVEKLRGKALPSLSSISPGEKSFFDEVIFLLKTFFFLYLGISMHFPGIFVLALGLGLTLAIYAGRILGARRLLPRDTDRRDAMYTSLMAPKGLASAVLAGLPLAAGMAGAAEIRDLTYMVIFLSIVITAVLVLLLEKTRVARLGSRIFHRFSMTGDGASQDC